jgi:hypothetical protein
MLLAQEYGPVAHFHSTVTARLRGLFSSEFKAPRHVLVRRIELAEMNARGTSPDDNFTPALEAIGNLLQDELSKVFYGGQHSAMNAHHEIELRPVAPKAGPFYQHFLPFREALVSVLAGTYRRLFKLAAAHPHQVGRDRHQWAWDQLQPAVGESLDQIRDWYVLACDGENRYVQHIGRVDVVPGQTASLPIPLSVSVSPTSKSWCAPAWMFAVGVAYTGIGPLKTENVPTMDSEEKLDIAHTRLLLAGARRLFLWALRAVIERVRNEETAAAGAIPRQAANNTARGPNKRKGWEQRVKLYRAIQKVLSANPELQGMEFCAELDKRHAPPLSDWTEREEWREGLTWKEAWGNPALRRKIRRVRQEAMKDR